MVWIIAALSINYYHTPLKDVRNVDLISSSSDSDQPVLAIVVLNTKSLDSWVHVLRREDHIEYMWPNIYISPQGRKDGTRLPCYLRLSEPDALA